MSLFIFYVLGHRYSRYSLWIAKVFLLLHCSNQIRKMRKKSGPELNHDYISYSYIKIRYRWNRGSGPLISLDHVRIRRPISSSCSWMLHRNPSLFLFFHRERFIPNHKSSLFFWILFDFRYGNAMHEVSKINQVVSDDKKSFFFMWNWWKPDI